MYVSVLEYALVRGGLAALRLVLRVVGLLFLAGTWVLAGLGRLVGRPLMREFARVLGRLRGHLQLAARSKMTGRRVTGAGRR